MPYFKEIMKAKITAKGQITLPASLRRQHGWRAGTVLEFDDSKSAVTVRESKRKRDPKRLIGCLKSEDTQGVLETLEDLRGAVALPPDQ
jgi:AbrB family looped-hinge helix DNA binding protein